MTTKRRLFTNANKRKKKGETVRIRNVVVVAIFENGSFEISSCRKCRRNKSFVLYIAINRNTYIQYRSKNCNVKKLSFDINFFYYGNVTGFEKIMRFESSRNYLGMRKYG